MDVQVFWNVIGNYNKQTWIIQIILVIFMLLAIMLSYMRKVKWAAKFSLGIVNLFIGITFFAWYGTEPVQKFFALPMYLLCGGLFLYESWCNRDDTIKKPNTIQAILLVLYLLYPFVSMLLGNYKILLALLTIWGLTGIKSLIFNAYEDIILLVCGLYGIMLFVSEIKQSKKVGLPGREV